MEQLENFSTQLLKDEIKRRDDVYVDLLINILIRDPNYKRISNDSKMLTIYLNELLHRHSSITKGIVNALEKYLKK